MAGRRENLCYSGVVQRLAGMRGLRHVALKVVDLKRSKAFYREVFGMEVVWEPDARNAYLSTGFDNLALHEVAPDEVSSEKQKLDHFGFVFDSVERVRALESELRDRGVRILQPFKVHRDGSASLYIADPDGFVIQLLYEPHLSGRASQE
jgi:catechol 2,3-dioxygenase-like lactoylglutathione lyase family enzyme